LAIHKEGGPQQPSFTEWMLYDMGISTTDKGQAKKDITRQMGEGADTWVTPAHIREMKVRYQAQYGVAYKDFIYRGSGGAGGTIHPISGRDVVGMLPENMSKLGGVTINNLIIHESGDPNKTFAMVKAAIKAAQA